MLQPRCVLPSARLVHTLGVLPLARTDHTLGAFALAGLALLAPGPPLRAAPAAEPWTVEDLLLTESVEAMEISPDGSRAVWVKSAMDKDSGKRASNLFLSHLDSGEEVQLTRGADHNRAPRFSPDGRLVAFLSDRPRPGKKDKEKGAPKAADTQLWLLATAGGEPWPATELAREIRDFAWKDGRHLVFAAQEDPTLFERGAEEGEDTSRVVEDAAHEPPVRLFLLDLDSRRVRRLSDNADWIDLLAVSPDGRWAVTRHQQSLSWEFDHKVPAATFLTDLDSGERRRLFEGTRLIPTSVAWEADGRGFYFSADHSRHPLYLTATVSRLYRYDRETGRHAEVDLGWERGLAYGGEVRAVPGGFVALLADGVHFRPARYTRADAAWKRTLLAGDHAANLFAWALSADGTRLVYERSTASEPPQWYRARLEGERIEGATRLTRLNPGWEGKPTPRSEVVRFAGARGEEVEGILRYPLDYREGERRPLVLSIHGGPTASDLDAWSDGVSDPMTLLCQRGAFVLQVNYHGSANYGLDWVESIGGGAYYDLEIPDLEAGVDWAIGRGLADPERLATLGWSNGGILSVELITRSRRYQAASIGAADVEWISDWGNVDFGASFDNYYLGASPLENPEIYVRKSPFFRLGQVTTPTIVYTGTEDRNVPPSQSWSLFRALQQHTSAPVRLVLFPGEPHGLRKYPHQKRKVEEDLAWFGRHLFGGPEPRPEALKPASPLAVALERGRASRVGGRLGVTPGGVLAPEVVAHRGLSLGRFEVTRAQFGAFDPSYRFPAGTEDFPATGLSFEQAGRYAAWLAQRTGAPYRLPTEREMRPLFEAARGKGNVLDHWAGYAPTPAEAGWLREQAASLGAGATLLAEVGRFDAAGEEEAVFDLGGNAAEWVVAEDGGGKLLGGSADLPSDAKSTAQADPAYRGFRVVRGEAPPAR